MRVSFEIATLVALAVAFAATGSEFVELLVLLGLLLVVIPIANRVFHGDEPDPFWEAVRGRGPVRRFSTWFLAFLVLAAVEFFVPSLSFGDWFWMIAILALSFEFDDVVARRTLRRHGTDRWNDPVPLTHSGVAGVVTVLLVFVTVALFHDRGVLEASAWALGSGFAVFALGVLVTVIVPVVVRSAQSQT